jgi:hypothetical protein
MAIRVLTAPYLLITAAVIAKTAKLLIKQIIIVVFVLIYKILVIN